MKTLKPTRISLALLTACCAQFAHAQTLGWLPVSDLPISFSENGDGPIIPSISSMCLWDPDGPGPHARSVVVAGSLELLIPDGRNIAYFDGDGWKGMRDAAVNSTVYSMVAYAAPGESIESLYVGQSNAGVFRRDGNVWTQISTALRPRAMAVLDLDGPGPQPSVLVIGGSEGVFTFDGTTSTMLSGEASPTIVRTVEMWDADGPGPLPARLLAGGTNILEWDGTQWNTYASANGPIYTLLPMDFDGDGPSSPELVAVGDFTTIGGVTTGPVAVQRNGTWVALGIGYTGAYLSHAISFDPDGPGPMTPWLVVAGNFSQIGGVSVPKLAYFNDNAWHAFPNHWSAEALSLSVNNEAGFSDSPQLMVGALRGIRPAFATFALCDNQPGFRNQPAGGRRTQGENISLGVVPTGDELTFRWYKNNEQILSGQTASGSIISGAASPRLTISDLTPEDVGEYRLTIGNAFGSVSTQSASVTVGCSADFNSDGTVDLFDYLDFFAAFANSDPVSDFNEDLEFDIFDYLDFVQRFAEGC